jgi:hypothetical protein
MMQTELNPFKMQRFIDWFNSRNNRIVEAKKFWIFRTINKNIQYLVLNRYLENYLGLLEIYPPPPPHKQLD